MLGFLKFKYKQGSILRSGRSWVQFQLWGKDLGVPCSGINLSQVRGTAIPSHSSPQTNVQMCFLPFAFPCGSGRGSLRICAQHQRELSLTCPKLVIKYWELSGKFVWNLRKSVSDSQTGELHILSPDLKAQAVSTPSLCCSDKIVWKWVLEKYKGDFS